mmetsp:Transcript_63995/g.169427  ORF Transcript_63995/g.169427 Transcript_63995/m.169427 type:complete len:247 (-) Transcript_63995:112-852(-)
MTEANPGFFELGEERLKIATERLNDTLAGRLETLENAMVDLAARLDDQLRLHCEAMESRFEQHFSSQQDAYEKFKKAAGPLVTHVCDSVLQNFRKIKDQQEQEFAALANELEKRRLEVATPKGPTDEDRSFVFRTEASVSNLRSSVDMLTKRLDDRESDEGSTPQVRQMEGIEDGDNGVREQLPDRKVLAMIGAVVRVVNNLSGVVDARTHEAANANSLLDPRLKALEATVAELDDHRKSGAVLQL